MNKLKQFTGRIPFWAYMLVLFVIFINVLYLFYKFQMPENGFTTKYENDEFIVDYLMPNSAGEKAGIKAGDVLVSINNMAYVDWSRITRIKAGETVTVKILRNGQPLALQLTYTIRNQSFLWFFVMMFIVNCLYTFLSLYLIYKKPDNISVRLFFLFMLCIAVCQNAIFLQFPEFLASLTLVFFIFCASILGPLLVHFHLLFPKPSKLIRRFPKLPLMLYIPAIFLFVGFSIFQVLSYHYGTDFYNSTALMLNRVLLYWITLNYCLALTTVIYQYREIKDTLARNQLLVIIIGSTFGMIAPIVYAFFFDSLVYLERYFTFIWESISGIGSLILVSCILIAIFRYRIWNTEIFIRKVLLYLGATMVITFSYFMLLYFVAQFTDKQTNLYRFLILAFSVIIFLVIRDWIQILIDRIFHRESYDSTTAVSDFEEKMAGIYRINELKFKIIQELDEIFHFETFILNLKKNGLIYECVYLSGTNKHEFEREIEINPEFEEKILKSKVFSPDEIVLKPSILNDARAELLVPMVKENQTYGFFICGQKKSEKSYSLQDIRVLTLIAKRIIALFHTAHLYQKDLDRQLMLERERARISQDMHDDIGAGLTRIAMISEDKIKSVNQDKVVNEKMLKVATTAREMINRLNVIVWALNPLYDNLDNLISYSRRYFGEYLENSHIVLTFNVPDEIPVIHVSPDFRRNIFYAMQEAIHNAVKHSACNEIVINLKMEKNTMLLCISDNGIGFSQIRMGSGGNGLMTMKKRAEDIGATFEIQSSPDKGTQLLFSLNLNEKYDKRVIASGKISL